MSYGFCRKFHTISRSAKFKKNRLKFDNKVIESLKERTFLRHSVVLPLPSAQNKYVSK